jgi:hypothetical protein
MLISYGAAETTWCKRKVYTMGKTTGKFGSYAPDVSTLRRYRLSRPCAGQT